MGAGETALLRSVRIGGGVTVHLRRSTRFTTDIIRICAPVLLDGRRTGRALLAGLLRRGSRRYADMDAIARHLQDLYGASFSTDVARIGPVQAIILRGEVVDGGRLPGRPDTFAALIAFLREMLHRPRIVRGRFDPRIFEEERAQLARFIASLADDKARYAALRLEEAMFRGHPLGLSEYGTLPDLESLRNEDVAALHGDLIARTPWHVFVSSRRPATEVLERVRSLVPRGRRAAGPEAPPPPPPARESTLIVREMHDVAQGKLCMGFRLSALPPARGRAVAMVLSALLGGGPASRLFRRVRERDHLAYAIHASLAEAEETIVVSAGIDPAAYRKAIEAVRSEVRDLARGRIGARELGAARLGLRRALRGLGDTQDSLLSHAAHDILLGVKPQSPAVLEAAVAKVRPADVARAAAGLTLDTVVFLARSFPGLRMPAAAAAVAESAP